MPEWSDTALILSACPHGKVLPLFLCCRVRASGRAGARRAIPFHAGVLQPGNMVSITWRARLEEHLGAMTAELSLRMRH